LRTALTRPIGGLWRPRATQGPAAKATMRRLSGCGRRFGKISGGARRRPARARGRRPSPAHRLTIPPDLARRVRRTLRVTPSPKREGRPAGRTGFPGRPGRFIA